MRSFCQIHVSEYADPEANCRECDVQREMEAYWMRAEAAATARAEKAEGHVGRIIDAVDCQMKATGLPHDLVPDITTAINYVAGAK